MLNLVVNFTPAAPGAVAFKQLSAILTDAGGTVRTVSKTAAVITTEAVLQPNGSYNLTYSFPTVAVGAYTVVVQAYDMNDRTMGSGVNGSGHVSLADGVWFPQPVSIS